MFLGAFTGACTVVKGVAASMDVESSITGSELGEWLYSNWLFLFVVATISNGNMGIFFSDIGETSLSKAGPATYVLLELLDLSHSVEAESAAEGPDC